MKLSVAQTVTGLDLAATLKDAGDGSFLCRQAGQNYIVVSEEGHSIKSGPTPIGPREFTLNQGTQAEPWIVTKLSNEDISGGYTEFTRPRGSH